MSCRLSGEEDLRDLIAANPDAGVVFLVGSEVSAPERPGEPGVWQIDGILDLIREEFSQPEQRARLEAKLTAAGPDDAYETAFDHLARTRGQAP